MKHILTIIVLCISIVVNAQSPYISRVWEFRPAPGQFINLLPEYEEGDTEETMRQKAEEAIADNAQELISLGSWGGYITFGFDHLVPNLPGQTDFIVYGNAFYSNSSEVTAKGGSSEPACIWVSYDLNGNGKPDDQWYELAGSEHNNTLTNHHYALTYYRTPLNHKPTPSVNNRYLTDTTYIQWHNSLDSIGYLFQLSFHQQDYFPLWLKEDLLYFEGTRLPDNYQDLSGQGTYYVQYAYDYGYADNHPNNTEEAKLDIDWAIDENGNPANLPGIHFVKVATGVHQQCGWIGETSTEISGAEDLHFTTALYDNQQDNQRSIAYYSLTGTYLGSQQPTQTGVYIKQTHSKTQKIVIE